MNQPAFLNTHSYILNFYSFLNEQNPYYYDQMNWMMEQLTQAEQAGEKVVMKTSYFALSINNTLDEMLMWLRRL